MGFLSGITGSLGGVGLGSAVVAVAVDTAPLKAGLESAKAEVAASTSSMTSATKAIGTGFIIAGAAAVLAMGKAVSSTMQLAMATRGLQRVTGQTAESASSLLFVAHELGVDAASLTQGFGLLAKNIDMNAPVLAKFGLLTKDASGATLDFNTILGEAADKYLALGGGMTGAAFAMELFGRGGKALIPILAQGSAGIAELEAAAKTYGVVLSQDTIDKVIELAHAQRELQSAFEGLKIEIGTNLVPLVTVFTHGLTLLVTAIGMIPAPVMDAVLIFAAMTGALMLGQKVMALVGAAWGPLIAAQTAGAVSAGEAAAAETLLALGMDAETIAAIAAASATGVFAIALDLALGPIGLVALAVGALVVVLGSVQVISAALAPGMAGITAALDAVKSSTEGATHATEDYTAAMQAQRDATASLLPGFVGILHNELALANAQKQLNHDIASGHAGRAQLQADNLAVLDAQLSLNTSFKDEATALATSGRNTDFIVKKLDALAAKAGMSGGQIQKLNGWLDDYISKLNAIPERVTSTVTINEVHHMVSGAHK